MNGLAIFAPVAPACSIALESSSQRDRAWASLSGLDTPEAVLFKSLFSEWHRFMTYRRYVMFWIPCGICCSHSSHLDALWQHSLFILQWYPACTWIPPPQFYSGEVWATTCLLLPRFVLLVAVSGCSKGKQLFRDGDRGSGRLSTSRGSMEEQLKAVLLDQLQGNSSAHAALPRHAACCARGQSACSSHCHLPQTWHKPGASSSLSLI